MKKLSFLALLVIFVLASCAQHKETSQTRFALHTMVGLTLFNSEPDSVFDEFYQELEKENALVSNWLAGSFSSQISDSAGIKPVLVTEDRIARLLKRSIQMSKESEGRFNVLIAPLTYLWGIGTTDPRVPSQKEITEVLSLLDLDKVKIEGNSFYLEEEGMSLDMGGLGKGYLVDHMVDWLKKQGIKKAIIDFGGNLYLHGRKSETEEWRIGIREPHEQAKDYMASLSMIPDQAISTSGSYERFFDKEDKRYHHILNARTGYPIDGDLAFVTVILPSGLEADYYSTLGLILGLEDGTALMQKKGIPAILVTKDGRVQLVGVNPQEFKLLDNSYRIIR